jgi:hypothetical protein
MEEGLAGRIASASEAARRQPLRGNLATGVFWLAGSAVVVAAQPGGDRKLAAVGAAVAGIAAILVLAGLTADPARRYFRSLIGAMAAVSVVGDLLVQHLVGSASSFVQYGLDTRIALPLIFVLLAPLVLRALPTRLRSPALWREHVWREARPLDWLAAAYALLILPALALGLHHHAPKTYIAQDLGLMVFFVFAYVAGRAVSADAARASAIELVVLLLALAVAQALLGWDTTPIFTYVEAACTGAIAFALLRKDKGRQRLLLLAAAIALLANDAVAIREGTGSTTSIELAAALGIVAYLVVRVRGFLSQRLVIAIAAIALAGFLAFTADGATVRGQYHGIDESNLGRAYEAHQVRETIRSSPVSFVFGRGLGGSIDETGAPKLFAESLVYGGRDLAHVQEVHLLPYEFLLKNGLLGFAWLAAFVAGVVILGIRALETAARERDPTPVVYAALPLLGVAAALAAATHLQDNPLNAFALGVLVTRLDGKALPSPAPRLRLGVAVPAAAAICAVVGAVAFAGSAGKFVFPGASVGGRTVPNAAAFVGGLRLLYPDTYHHRYFDTADPAVTGAHGVRVKGVVVASYRLEKSPEFRGAGARFHSNGVFFEVYEAPRNGHLAPAKKLPLTIFDLPDMRALNDKASLEQGGLLFSVNGRNYGLILWVGAHAPKSALLTVDGLVSSLEVHKPAKHKPEKRKARKR